LILFFLPTLKLFGIRLQRPAVAFSF